MRWSLFSRSGLALSRLSGSISLKPENKVSSEYAKIIYNQSFVTNPGDFTMEDVIFTGILRVKSNLEAPVQSDDTVKGICRHFNYADKD